MNEHTVDVLWRNSRQILTPKLKYWTDFPFPDIFMLEITFPLLIEETTLKLIYYQKPTLTDYDIISHREIDTPDLLSLCHFVF